MDSYFNMGLFRINLAGEGVEGPKFFKWRLLVDQWPLTEVICPLSQQILLIQQERVGKTNARRIFFQQIEETPYLFLPLTKIEYESILEKWGE